jgi:hypothetical protein
MTLELWTQRLSALDEDIADWGIDEVFELVSKVEMNGWEISNTISTASTLARSEGTKLQIKHIEMILQIWNDFESSLEKRALIPRQGSMVGSTNLDHSDSMMILDKQSK